MGEKQTKFTAAVHRACPDILPTLDRVAQQRTKITANEHIPKLLRAIAGGADAQEQQHDIIFNVAADEIERLRAALERIRNVLHAHNRPDTPLPNAKRIACRDLADLALEK